MNFENVDLDERRTLMASDITDLTLYLRPEGTFVKINAEIAVALLDRASAEKLLVEAEQDAEKLAETIRQWARNMLSAQPPEHLAADAAQSTGDVMALALPDSVAHDQLTVIGAVDGMSRLADKLSRTRAQISAAQAILDRGAPA